MPRYPGRVPLFLFTLAATVLLTSLPATGSAFRNLKEGQTIPGFTLKDADGKDVTFKPDGGKVTVLSFVDLAQDRSKEQIKDLVALHGELAAKGTEIIALTKYTNTPEEAKKMAADLGVKFPILLDKDQRVYGDYGLYIFPCTGIVGKDGKFSFEHSSHGADYRTVVGGRVKMLLGLMTEADFKKLTTPVETPQKSKEESEAERQLALGTTLSKRGMHDKAIEHFAKAAELTPNSLPARLAYGEALLAAKKADEAMVQFQKAREINPASKDAQLGLGACLLQKGETDKAIAEISAAAMLNPKPAKANYWLGAAYEKKGDLPNAVKYYRKAIEKLLVD